MTRKSYRIKPVGVVHSPLTSLDDAPRQGDEVAVEAWLELSPAVAPGLLGIAVGDELIILTWLHLADREVLQVHPRGDPERPLRGVFSTRSPDRPNPIGLHQVTVLEVATQSLKIAPLEAIDGTPVVDIKPVLGRVQVR